jgi:16S rRNA processing protein RimM
MSEYVEIGRIVRPRGLRGELLVAWNNGHCPVPEKTGQFFLDSEGRESLQVERTAPDTKHERVWFFDITNRDRAEALKGKLLYARADDLPALEEGEFYAYQLLGMKVITLKGDEVGEIEYIFSNGAHDVYVVRDGNGRELMIPSAGPIIDKIDADENVMTIHWDEGLVQE